MGVYIKDMDLPVSCFNCPLETDYGTCGHFTGKDYAKYQSNYNKRPEWCPLIEMNIPEQVEEQILPCHCHAKRQPYWQRFRSIYRLKCPCCQLTIEADSKEEAIRGWNNIQKEFGNNGNIRRLLN